MQTLEELSAFLHGWYDEPDGALGWSDWTCPHDVKPPLAKAWTLFGKLCLGNEDWMRMGEPSPLACQNAFMGPESVKPIDDIFIMECENQGNWVSGYRLDDPEPDPQIWSNWINVTETTAQDYWPVGAKLSDFIITLVLQETIFFGLSRRINENDISDQCNRVLWEGYYMNAIGSGQGKEGPSHLIRTNNDLTQLSLDMNGKFSRFACDMNVARNVWRDLQITHGLIDEE